jgi:hypothetical protein
MDDENKLNQLENNQRNFKRENDRANSTYQRLIKELKKKWNHKKNQKIKKCNFDRLGIISVSLKFAMLVLLSF